MPASAAPAHVDVPRLPSDAISRPRLVTALENPSPLTVLRGASGLGKTVALAEWARASTSTIVWVTVDATRSHSAELAHDVLRASARGGLPAPSADEILHPWSAVAQCLNETAEELVLVLDDAATLSPESVFDLCRTVAAAPRARVIASTNRRSAFDRDGLSLVIDRTLLGPEDLLFDVEEISRALGVDESHAADILQATGGYPALIHAASKRSTLGDDPSSAIQAASPAVEEYMQSRLESSGIDPGVLESLVRISVADAVDLASARALSGRDEIEGALDDAEAFGLGSWSAERLFLFAPVVRTLLRRELVRSHSAELSRLMNLAVEGALQRRAPMDALQLAMEYDDLPLASHVIMSGWSQLLDHHGPAAVRLLRRLPVSRLKDQPLIAMLLAICYNASKLRRLRGLQLMRVAISAANSRRSEVATTERVFIWAAESAALRLIGMSERAAQVAARALSLYRETPESVWQPYALEMPLLCTHLGISLYYGGREDAAIECFENAAAMGASHDLSKAFHSIALLSGIHALNGDMPEARHYAELIRESSWEQQQLDGYRGTFYRVAEALLAVEDGDTTAAREHVRVFGPHRATSEHWATMGLAEACVALHEGRAAAGLEQLESLRRLRKRETGSAHARHVLSRARALLHLAVGDVAAARTTLRHDARPDEFGTIVERARIALVEGDASEAARMLAQTRQIPQTSRQRAEAAAIQVAALRRTAGETAAQKAAVALHIRLEDRELATPVALFAPEDVELLQDALGTHHSGRLVTAVLPATSDRPRLSARELVVLRALTSGAALPSIAADLNVSQNTLKTQLRSIYRKLDARNRADAIERAAKHDLLTDR
nr:LuxR C-terminal-related transcriptional regulator [Microbacterium hydrocarbonoxydans]